MYKKRVTLQNMQHITREEALSYHRDGRPGKLEIRPTKPMRDQHDLSLAYTPGVAEPVKEIADDPAAAYEYTNKGNLVGIITSNDILKIEPALFDILLERIKIGKYFFIFDCI